MNTLLDHLFARRPKIHYVCPPICGLQFVPTSSGSPSVSIDEGIPALGCVNYHFTDDKFLTWDPYPGAFCYTVYQVVDVQPAPPPPPPPPAPPSPPVITDQPDSQTIFEGDPVTFFVTATGDAPITYQWRKDGVIMFGETNSSLTIAAVAESDEADYTVILTNAIGMAGSDAAVLTVEPPPATPDAFPGLEAWWKADSLSLADGATVGEVGVSEWTDSSGNGHYLTNASAPQRPLFFSSIVGDKPIVRFNGSKILYPFAPGAISATAGNPFTIILVAKTTVASVFGGHDGDVQYIVRGATTMGIRFGFAEGAQHDSAVLTGAIGSPECLVWRRQSGAPGDGSFLENNVAKGTWATPFPVGNFSLQDVGGCLAGFYTGDVAELIFYTSYLSDTDLADLYLEYFKPRFSPLP